MARPVTWYSDDLGDHEPIAAIRETLEQIRSLTAGWSPAQFERAYAPDKWTARQILIHLAQTEVALGYRVRMALASPNYAAQNFNQDQWLVHEASVSAADALGALLSLGRMNQSLFASLSADQLATGLTHPEYGALTVDWIIHQPGTRSITSATSKKPRFCSGSRTRGGSRSVRRAVRDASHRPSSSMAAAVRGSPRLPT
jgi:hypothetical protein